MLSWVRRKTTYANVAMTLALVFAMAGGAYAAGKFVITSTKQIKPSVLAQLKGKVGPAGPQGAAGPAGPAGANGKDGVQGKEGPVGKEGPAGKDGAPGAEGVSVTSTQSATTIDGTHCVGVGGSKFVSGSGSTYACNGKEGKEGLEGKEGSPWTAGGTLPSKKSEYGSWATPALADASETKSEREFAAISFPIPLAAAPAGHVVLSKVWEGQIGAGEGELCEGKSGTELNECEAKYKAIQAVCPGNAGNPVAEPGNLCVYEGFTQTGHSSPIFSLFTFKPAGGPGASTFGALVMSVSTEPTTDGTAGSWVVTAP
jgi:hypothetical protein